MTPVETEYQARLAAMTGAERIARSAAMLKWTREMIARQIESAIGPISEEQLKWKVALRVYGLDKKTRKLIERKLEDVSS